jgi:hypothetical protein
MWKIDNLSRWFHHHITSDRVEHMVVTLVLDETVFVMLVVVFLMIIAKNRTPRPYLDKMYIWQHAALWVLVFLTSMAQHGKLIPLIMNPWIQIAIWGNLGLAEIGLVWFIYQERFVRRRRQHARIEALRRSIILTKEEPTP